MFDDATAKREVGHEASREAAVYNGIQNDAIRRESGAVEQRQR